MEKRLDFLRRVRVSDPRIAIAPALVGRLSRGGSVVLAVFADELHASGAASMGPESTFALWPNMLIEVVLYVARIVKKMETPTILTVWRDTIGFAIASVFAEQAISPAAFLAPGVDIHCRLYVSIEARGLHFQPAFAPDQVS